MAAGGGGAACCCLMGVDGGNPSTSSSRSNRCDHVTGRNVQVIGRATSVGVRGAVPAYGPVVTQLGTQSSSAWLVVPRRSPRVLTVRTSAKADRQCVVRGDGPGHSEVVLLFLGFEQTPEIAAAEHAKREESGITLSHVLDDIDVEVQVALGFLDLARLQPEIIASARPARGLDLNDTRRALYVAGTARVPSVLGQPPSRPLQLDNPLDRGVLNRLIARQLGHAVTSVSPFGAYKIDHRARRVTAAKDPAASLLPSLGFRVECLRTRIRVRSRRPRRVKDDLQSTIPLSRAEGVACQGSDKPGSVM